MGISREQVDRLIDAHFQYEHSDDVNGVLATLAPDARHDIVGWPSGPTVGRENARAFYENMFDDLADGRTRSVRRLYGEGFVVDESIWEGRAAGQPFGFDGRDRPLTFRILHVFEYDDNGAILSENVWCDFLAIARQLTT
ncbi:MAG TPA: ester cyclase [Phycisphaerae bacterium]|nr:ester cyclase [Phycisphaerales bacterium]HRX83547.1 ester cyclase [Phycisphaerae bacterium]